MKETTDKVYKIILDGVVQEGTTQTEAFEFIRQHAFIHEDLIIYENDIVCFEKVNKNRGF
jgi:hypothetical protein